MSGSPAGPPPFDHRRRSTAIRTRPAAAPPERDDAATLPSQSLPPAETPVAAAPADWYDDPSGHPGRLRYWDGGQWTEHYHEVVAVADDPESSAEPAAVGTPTSLAQLPPPGGPPIEAMAPTPHEHDRGPALSAESAPATTTEPTRSPRWAVVGVLVALGLVVVSWQPFWAGDFAVDSGLGATRGALWGLGFAALLAIGGATVAATGRTEGVALAVGLALALVVLQAPRVRSLWLLDDVAATTPGAGLYALAVVAVVALALLFFARSAVLGGDVVPRSLAWLVAALTVVHVAAAVVPVDGLGFWSGVGDDGWSQALGAAPIALAVLLAATLAARRTRGAAALCVGALAFLGVWWVVTGSTTPTDPRADFAYFDHTSGVPALVSAGALLLAAAAGVLAVFRSPSPGGRYPRLLGVGLGIVVLVGGGVAGALSDRVDASIAESVSLDELRTAGGGAELWELANECASGERAACVELHATAPEGSPYRDYARTCGERHQPALRFCR